MTTTETGARSSSKHAYLVVVGACMIAAVIGGMAVNSVGIFLRPISADLGIGLGQAGIYITILYCGMAVFLPPFGKLIDRIDVRILAGGCVVIAAAALFSMTFFHHIWLFYIFALFVAAAATFALFQAGPILVNRWFAKRVGFWLGFIASFSGVGAVIFNSLGAYLIETQGWRFAWKILALIIIVFGGTGTLLLRSRPSDVGAIPIGADPQVIAERAAAGKSATELPGITTSRALRSPVFYLIVIFAFLLATAAAGTLQYFSPIAQDFGFSITAAGVVVSIVSVGNMLGKPFLGFISDKNIFIAVAIGMGSGLISLTLLLTVAKSSPFLVYLAGGLFGLVVASAIPMSAMLVRYCFGSRNYSVIWGWVAAAISVGSGFGSMLLGFVRDWTGSFQTVFFLVMGVLVLCCIMCMVSLRAGKSFHDEFTVTT